MSSTTPERYLTHYYRRSPSAQGWITTSFVTQKEGDEKFYLGMSNHHILPKDMVEGDVEIGFLKKVARTLIDPQETLWITPQQDIVIGSFPKPRQGALRIIDRDTVTLSDAVEREYFTKSVQSHTERLKNQIAEYAAKEKSGRQ